MVCMMDIYYDIRILQFNDIPSKIRSVSNFYPAVD